MKFLSRTLLVTVVLWSIAGVPSAKAQSTLPGEARNFPIKPLRLILPVGPGSNSDTASRFIAEKMSGALGQPVVVENKPGGEFQIGLQALLSAPADGHTLLLISPGSMVVNPVMIENWPIDVKQRVRPIVQINRSTAVLTVADKSRFRTLRELLAAGRASPRAVSVGNYSPYFLSSLDSIARASKLEFNNIPYKGATQALTDVMGGTLDMAFTDVTGASQLIESGKIRALAVTSPERLKAFPNVPTVREEGIKDYAFSVWVGYAVRSETPDAISNLLGATVIDILRSPEFAAFNKANGDNEIVAGDGAALSRQIDRETEELRKSLGKK